MTDTPTPDPTGDPFSRRRFLTRATGVAAGSLVLWHPLGRAAAGATDGGRALRAGARGALEVAGTATGLLTLVRPSDQLLVTFGFINLEVQGDLLVPVGSPAALAVTVGSQHAAEQSISLAAGDAPPTATQTMARRAAGPSRVVVAVDEPLPFTVDGLLGALDGVPRLDARATGSGGSGPPAGEVTAIEVPADVVLSPTDAGRFLAATAPVESDGVTELWRLRLGAPDGGGTVRDAAADAPVEMRAIDGANAPDAFPRALTQSLRQDLVAATTGWSSPAYPDNEPLQARRFWLSLHGARAELAGSWAGTGTLASYAELIASGATLITTVVTRGYLAPFGIPASVVTVTDRRFEVATDGSTVAVLDTHERLVLEDARVEVPRPHMPDDGRRLPFRWVEVVGTAEPLVRGTIEWTDPTGPRSIDPDEIFGLFDPATGDEAQFDHLAEDRAGNTIAFRAPAWFVTGNVAFDTGKGLHLVPALAHLEDFLSEGTLPTFLRRWVTLGGQALAFADEAVPGSGATTKAAQSMLLTLDRPTDRTADEMRTAGQPAFYPALESAQVTDDAVNSFSGGSAMTSVSVRLDQTWLSEGNGPNNSGNAFLALVSPTQVDFGDSEGGGLVAPVLSVDTLSQDLGATSDEALTSGQWDPATMLGDARLLGIIPLADILGSVALAGPDLGAIGGVPAFRSLSLPDEVCHTFTWEPALQTLSLLGTDVFVVTDDLGGGLEDPFAGPSEALVEMKACVGLAAAAPPSTALEVSIRNVVLQLPPGAPALAVQLGEVRWSASDGSPGSLDVDITGYQFVGALVFLEPFRNFLSSGLADVSIDIDPTVGVDAAIRIEPPDFSLGVFGVSDIWVALELFVPFGTGGDPFHTRFNVGSKGEPLSISVLLFKGTASFALKLRPPPEGIVRFVASLGVGIELKAGGFGVKGAVGIELAAFIEYDRDLGADGEIIIGGLFRIHGSITVWAVAEVGVEALLELRYLVNTKLLRAKGSVVGWITVLGAHKEWELEVTEDFDLTSGGGTGRMATPGLDAATSGGHAAGSFGAAYDERAWADYCRAFA
jgi:hypothetical protein